MGEGREGRTRGPSLREDGEFAADVEVEFAVGGADGAFDFFYGATACEDEAEVACAFGERDESVV